MCTYPVPPTLRPYAHCDFNDCELYPGDAYYLVDGLLICDDCLTPFSRSHWKFCRRVLGEEDAFCIR